MSGTHVETSGDQAWEATTCIRTPRGPCSRVLPFVIAPMPFTLRSCQPPPRTARREQAPGPGHTAGIGRPVNRQIRLREHRPAAKSFDRGPPARSPQDFKNRTHDRRQNKSRCTGSLGTRVTVTVIGLSLNAALAARPASRAAEGLAGVADLDDPCAGTSMPSAAKTGGRRRRYSRPRSLLDGSCLEASLDHDARVH